MQFALTVHTDHDMASVERIRDAALVYAMTPRNLTRWNEGGCPTLKIIDLAHARSIPMDGGRGRKTKLVDASLGTQAVDVHMNALAPGGPRGKLHKHSAADNVYIVRKGVGELIVEGAARTILSSFPAG